MSFKSFFNTYIEWFNSSFKPWPSYHVNMIITTLLSFLYSLFLASLPYKAAIAVSFSSGIIALPMIFELNTVMWFNELFVTTGINTITYTRDCYFILYNYSLYITMGLIVLLIILIIRFSWLISLQPFQYRLNYLVYVK